MTALPSKKIAAFEAFWQYRRDLADAACVALRIVAAFDGSQRAASIGPAFVVPRGGRGMKRRIAALFVGGLLALVLFGIAAAGQLEDGEAAYRSGDYAEAARLWRPLAEKGDAKAQNNLGLTYRDGLGVLQDYAQALKWFGKAADQGDAFAQYNLGSMLAYPVVTHTH
jgi:tetratricopeptide (TPR) repeat protein